MSSAKIKTKPLRLVILGEPKLYKPFGAKFLIRLTTELCLVFVPRWYVKKGDKISIKKTGIVEYVFSGVEQSLKSLLEN